MRARPDFARSIAARPKIWPLARMGSRAAVMVGAPVDNRDKRRRPGGGRARVYTGQVPRITRVRPYAFSAAISRRAACPPSGLGGRGPAREAQEGRAGMEGALALQQGKDALVYGQ